MDENCENVADILKALAHPQRLMILCHLLEGKKTVGELHQLCNLSQSHASQFLARLRREGFVKVNKEANFSYYSLSNPKVTKLLKALHSIFAK